MNHEFSNREIASIVIKRISHASVLVLGCMVISILCYRNHVISLKKDITLLKDKVAILEKK